MALQALPMPDLQESTLLLPVVAVGNVAQLAVDLIVNTLHLQRMARITDPALLPAIGCKAYAHVTGLATAMELYQPGSGGTPRVAVVQQRAAAAPGTQDAFAQRLAAFVKQSGVKEVLVLGSVEAAFRRDAQLVGPQLRCWAPDAASSASLLQRCRVAAAGGVPPLEPIFLQDRPLGQHQLPPWPLLRALQQHGVPCTALLSFSTEGDNVSDAFEMASAAAAAAGLIAAGAGSIGGSETAPAAAAAAGLIAAGAGSIGGSETAPAAAQLQWQPPHSWQFVYGATAAVY